MGFLRKLFYSAAITGVMAGAAYSDAMNYIGVWSATARYARGAVVVYNNQTYYALASNRNVVPTPIATQWKLIGTNGMDYEGTWNSSTTYWVGSVVTYKDQNFYSLRSPNLNKNPESQRAHWVLVGTNSNTVRSGAGIPLSTQGVVGDFWIDTTNKVLYGPKTASGWPLQGTSMVGPQGAVGPQGPQGTVGAQGLQGPQGPAGGPQGVAGAQGPQGPQGAAGPQGSTGVQGALGPQGLQGATGPQGAAGPAGPQGPAGPAGTSGTNGTNGTNGASGLFAGQINLTSTPVSRDVFTGNGVVSVAGSFETVQTAYGIKIPKATGIKGIYCQASGSSVTVYITIYRAGTSLFPGDCSTGLGYSAFSSFPAYAGDILTIYIRTPTSGNAGIVSWSIVTE